MTTIGKVWTAGIAYVALAAGAGLSIMYNILDTIQVRGAAFDWADLVTAVAAPAIVLLMVEMFVSRIWVGQAWHIQVIRWLATVAIGGVAMRTSWTHGHDFMASRGQSADVATLWPLAIDLLAIMATALILAGRTRGHVATPVATAMAKLGDVVDSMATGRAYGHLATEEVATTTIGRMATPEEVAMARMAKAEQDGHAMVTDSDPFPLGGHEDVPPPWKQEDAAGVTQPLSEEYAATLAAELEAWQGGADLAVERAGQELAAEVEARYRAGQEWYHEQERARQAEAAQMEAILAASTVPSEAVNMIQSWDGQDGAALDARVAQQFGRSIRTARRWRSLVAGLPAPVSNTEEGRADGLHG